MNTALAGKNIVVAGSQKTEEMTLIIEKQGAKAYIRPLQGITFYDEQAMEQELLGLVDQGADWVIFTTGIGAKALFTIADQLGLQESFAKVIAGARIAIRGYKTYAFLKQQGFAPDIYVEDGTMQGLIESLNSADFNGQRIAVQLHGEHSPELERHLQDKQAKSVQYLLPYRNTPPEPQTVEQLLTEILSGAVDAVCFTTRVQVGNLFSYARQTQQETQLIQAFEDGVVAAAVGKVTAQALQHEGVTRMVYPELERMGAMVVELSNYYAQLPETEA